MLERTIQYLDAEKTEYTITMRADTILEAIKVGGYSNKMKGISPHFSDIFGRDVFGNYFYGTRSTWLDSFLKSFKRLFNVPEKKVRVGLFKFNRPSNVVDGENFIDEEIICNQMGKDGYIPCRTIHLLNFGINYPKIREKSYIVAFGTQVYIPHTETHAFSPALIGNPFIDEERYSIYAYRPPNLWSFNRLWSIKIQFLGIKRADNSVCDDDGKKFVDVRNSYC